MRRWALIALLPAFAACVTEAPPPDPPAETPAPTPTPLSPVLATTVEIESGQNITELLLGLGVERLDALRIVDVARPIHDLARLRAGEVLFIRVERATGRLLRLSYPIDRYAERKLVVERDSGQWTARLEREVVARHGVAVEGVVRDSLWASCERVGLGAEEILSLARIFEYEIDFNTMVQGGDRFRLVLDEVRSVDDGERVRWGEIQAAEYVTQGVPLRAFRHVDGAGQVGWFNEYGEATRRMFLKSPLEFSRITSGFSKRRFHPVLKSWRAHKGIDYAADSGTPIRSIGHGRVEFAGIKGGYGKHVRVRHGGNYGSSYSHLSGIAVRDGQNVSQGQVLGYVGATGLATGPHLHFEFYVGGDYVDFLAQRFPRTEPLTDAERPAFQASLDRVLGTLDGAVRSEPPAEPVPRSEG